MNNKDIKKYIKDFIKYVPGCIYYKDINGHYLALSDYLIQESNLRSATKVIGKTDYDIFSPEQADKLKENDKKVIETGKACAFEEFVNLPNGKSTFYEVVKAPFWDSKGNMIGIIGNSVNITKQKETEASLTQAKEQAEIANQLKSQFITNMEHDIRTPCSGIAQMAMLLETREGDPEKREILGHVAKGAKQLLDLLNNILAFDHVESGQIPVLHKKFNVRKVINDVVELENPSAKLKELELLVEHDANIPEILIGDEHRLRRILINLISNAVKFTEKGYVRIKVELAQQNTFRDLILRFIIKDTGIGIHKDKQHIIYEKFTRGTLANQGAYKGAGLGLRIVKQFIGELEGEIDVESDVGQGTTFICILPFSIPLLQQQKLDPKKPDINPEPKTKSQQVNILLVEDDKLAQLVARNMLENEHNCKVQVAATGKEALALAKKYPYGMIFMDIGLPDLNGHEVTKKIRAGKNKNSATPIIALTAHNAIDARKASLAAGMDDFLIKPLDPAKAKLALDKWINGKSDIILKNTKKSDKILEKTVQDIIDIKLAKKVLGKPETVKKILKMFIDMVPEHKHEIDSAFAANNYQELEDAAHKLIGAACYCGTTKLKKAATDLKIAARKQETEKLKRLVNQAHKEMDAVVKASKKLFRD